MSKTSSKTSSKRASEPCADCGEPSTKPWPGQAPDAEPLCDECRAFADWSDIDAGQDCGGYAE